MANQYSPQSRINRLSSIQKGVKTYESETPCRICGTVVKYVKNSSCFQCVLERTRHSLYDGTMDKYHTPEKKNAFQVKWRKANPEKVKEQRKRVRVYQAAYQSARREKIKKQTIINANTQSILIFYEEAKNLTQKTGIPHEVDHIIPISRGGLHHPSNLQILTQRENRQKGNKL